MPGEQELLDIALVRERTGLLHVLAAEARDAFSDGHGVFDVDPRCRRLDAFLEKNKLKYCLDSEDFLPGIDEGSLNRPVYYARAH